MSNIRITLTESNALHFVRDSGEESMVRVFLYGPCDFCKRSRGITHLNIIWPAGEGLTFCSDCLEAFFSAAAFPAHTEAAMLSVHIRQVERRGRGEGGTE